tara:strand:- start:31 stop:861 length:831 start_codon:yes stop_codon:yes gene_type:complete
MTKLYSNKIDNDKFYTKNSTAKICIDIIDFSIYDFVIEPSAGNGSFLSQIPHANKIGIDINPECDDILKMSWFDYATPDTYSKVLIIGNPPFGIRNNLSKKFIKHSVSFSNVYTIAFILPNVYNKHTMQRVIPKEYRIKTALLLPENSFEIESETYHVPCTFYVFEKSKGPNLRFDPSIYQDTTDWKYGNDLDYNFYVMGASFEVKDKPEKSNRGYYIKVNPNKDVVKVKNNFERLRVLRKQGQVKGYSSVNGGVFWTTKPELVKIYKEEYDNAND